MTRCTLFAPLLLASCIDRPVTEVVPVPENVENLTFDVLSNDDLDILFVIDDSRSMAREQLELAENFDAMIGVLENLPTGLPDLHLGVISTDVGAGASCPVPSPGAGVLRNAPTVSGCSPPSDRWISDVADDAGGRIRNYTGTLADTFSCIAQLGTTGCGFEQPLEAMRRALDPATTLNAGFLRPDAYLAVVFLTDEDDCSAYDVGLFDPNAEDLGVLGNHRCFAYGIECDGGVDPYQHGLRESCGPIDDSPYLEPIAEYVDALKAAKPRPDKLIVAGIMGDPEPIRVGLNEDNETEVVHSCEIEAGAEQGGAYPPIRTDAFLSQFPQRARSRICDADLTSAITEVAEVIQAALLSSCIQGDLLGDVPECSVTEFTDAGEDILPYCNAGMANAPCWTVEPNPDKCFVTDHHLELVIHYPPGVVREAGDYIDAQCRTE